MAMPCQRVHPMALSERQQKEITLQLNTYCNARVPVTVRDVVRLSFRFGPHDVVLFEGRPQWDDRSIWHENPIAKFRYVSSREEWRLYSVDQRRRWHEYRPQFAGPDLESLLAKVDKDPTGIFWG